MSPYWIGCSGCFARCSHKNSVSRLSAMKSPAYFTERSACWYRSTGCTRSTPNALSSSAPADVSILEPAGCRTRDSDRAPASAPESAPPRSSARLAGSRARNPDAPSCRRASRWSNVRAAGTQRVRCRRLRARRRTCARPAAQIQHPGAAALQLRRWESRLRLEGAGRESSAIQLSTSRTPRGSDTGMISRARSRCRVTPR